MQLPYPTWMDKVPFVATITGGLSDKGVPTVVTTYSGKCCFSEKATMKRDADGQLIQLNGSLTVGVNIAPSVKTIEGYVTIDTVIYKIYSAQRLRNPDGTIHHTRLDLI